MTTPATDGPTAQAMFRVTLVTPLANVRSDGFTTAITYDWRVGTSISTSASRARNSAPAIAALGDAGTAIRKRLDGRCVHTMVFNSPMRRASQAAARWDSAFRTRAAKNNTAILLKEPVGDKRGVQEAAADAVQPEQQGQARDDAFAPGIERSASERRIGRDGCFDVRRQFEVRHDADQGRTGAHQKCHAMRSIGLERCGTHQDGWNRGGERAECMAAVQREVVPSQRPRPALVGYRHRQNRLIERRRGPAIAAHPVQHPDERERHEGDGVREYRERQVAHRAQQRETDQNSPSSPCVATKADDDGRE